MKKRGESEAEGQESEFSFHKYWGKFYNTKNIPYNTPQTHYNIAHRQYNTAHLYYTIYYILYNTIHVSALYYYIVYTI